LFKALQVYHGIKATILNHHESLALKPSSILHLLLFFISSLDIISTDKSDAFLIWLNEKNYLAWEFHIKVFIEANGL
jgi:hypothetical protein